MKPSQFDEINLLPDKDNEHILRTIAALGIHEKPIYVDIRPDVTSRTGDCFENVLNKVRIAEGEAAYGWQFAEYAYMIEAEFHAVWKDPLGNLVDITPSGDPTATKILFVIDRNKTFSGKRTDNFRLNTTQNELVNDIIELEQAKFKLIDGAESVDADERVLFSKEEKVQYQLVFEFSLLVDEMCRRNMTVHSKCFCNSGKPYAQCHRILLKQLLAAI